MFFLSSFKPGLCPEDKVRRYTDQILVFLFNDNESIDKILIGLQDLRLNYGGPGSGDTLLRDAANKASGLVFSFYDTEPLDRINRTIAEVESIQQESTQKARDVLEKLFSVLDESRSAKSTGNKGFFAPVRLPINLPLPGAISDSLNTHLLRMLCVVSGVATDLVDSVFLIEHGKTLCESIEQKLNNPSELAVLLSSPPPSPSRERTSSSSPNEIA